VAGEKLYYNDSFLLEFDARVLSCEAAGDRWHAVLERTAFYPTSGGQPHDTGRLGDAAVVEVIERDDHTIVHVLDCAVPVGPARGVIDAERRFDHMQQHTGQYILSAVFLSLFEFPTVSFHLGRDISTIDLAAKEIAPEHLEAAERRANEIVFADRPVAVRFGTAQELAEAGIRKAVDREGVLRAIEIEGCDRQPCGGTHVTRTGQIGMLLLRKCERVKQNWRVEFVCGHRALRAARGDFETLSEAAGQLSCGLPHVPAMVARALEERQTGHRARQKLVEQLAEVEALMLLATKSHAGKAKGTQIVMHVFEAVDADYLRLLATKLVAQPGVQALLASRDGNVVFAQSPGLPGEMNALLRGILAPAGGKGGGTKEFAQGRVPDPAAMEAVLGQGLKELRG